MSRVSILVGAEQAERRAKALDMKAPTGPTEFALTPRLTHCRQCSTYIVVALSGDGVVRLDRSSHDDGAHVLVNDNHNPRAVAYDASAHAEWRRWREHRCEGSGR